MELDADAEAPFWQLVDRVAQMRNLSDRELRLVSDILEVVATHAVARPARRLTTRPERE